MVFVAAGENNKGMFEQSPAEYALRDAVKAYQAFAGNSNDHTLETFEAKALHFAEKCAKAPKGNEFRGIAEIWANYREKSDGSEGYAERIYARQRVINTVSAMVKKELEEKPVPVIARNSTSFSNEEKRKKLFERAKTACMEHDINKRGQGHYISVIKEFAESCVSVQAGDPLQIIGMAYLVYEEKAKKNQADFGNILTVVSSYMRHVVAKEKAEAAKNNWQDNKESTLKQFKAYCMPKAPSKTRGE